MKRFVLEPVTRTVIGCLLVVAVARPGVQATAQDAAAPVESFLVQGKLADGAAAMQKLINEDPEDQQARFSLGVVQFFQAIEGLGQDQYRYGLLGGRSRAIPFMRLPIPENSEPEEISYQKARALVQRFVDRLTTAEQTLSAVTPDDIRLPLKLGSVKLDLDGNGKLTNTETMWHISQVLQNPRIADNAAAQNNFPVVFDAADVPWLQGYCHALSAVGETVLAYDWQDQFERTAHLFYPRVDAPYDFLAAEGPGVFMSFGPQNILDFIAWLHTINYEVVEPERMQKALMHMETVIRLSRQSWKSIEAETDDDHEWVPGADQTSVMNGFKVGRDVISGWHEFLDEMESILQGRQLVPFWRGIKGGIPLGSRLPQNPNVGINVRKIFTQPTRFDLALWIQGTALTPYLEEGEIVSAEKWGKMMARFRGNFLNFALWFN
ncbi:MAG: hypothetical protein GY758_04275 [Fuerstiella sp.]|nr:hypothetical protein [Fuerstiella sp.]MCP4511284.1 hypothetical protein [Fuerstiella sp.]